jgi:hypothetical protein
VRFLYTVGVEVERDEGKFASRDEIAEQIEQALIDADLGTISCDEGGEYSTTEWGVQEEDVKTYDDMVRLWAAKQEGRVTVARKPKVAKVAVKVAAEPTTYGRSFAGQPCAYCGVEMAWGQRGFLIHAPNSERLSDDPVPHWATPEKVETKEAEGGDEGG